MKPRTFRLPENLVAEIDAEAKSRRVSRSDVVRERLETYAVRALAPPRAQTFQAVAGDLVGSVSGDRLPSDLSVRKKHYLKALGYGQET
jgi:hypothetical protein